MSTQFHNLSTKLRRTLFNTVSFRSNLTVSRDSLVTAYCKIISDGNSTLDLWFNHNVDINTLVNARAWFIDQILKHAWNQCQWNESNTHALLAVGGYGRAELHPASDIDILILLEHNKYTIHQKNIELFLTLLWDIGLKVGSSVRSLDECIVQAENNLSIITSQMESRVISGSKHLHNQLLNSISTKKMWPSKVYLKSKFEEQRARHHKLNNTEYNLEPNIKVSPGGLRDLHMLGWVVHRHYGTSNLTELVKLKFLTQSEYKLLTKCRSFLWKIRWALHSLNKRCEDRLLFDYQKNIADTFHYSNKKGSLAVEQFMQHYYRTVITITQLNDLLLQHFDDDILRNKEKNNIISINKRFQIRNNYIETTNRRVFIQFPPAILEIFVLITRNPYIHGVRAETIRLLRNYRYLVDHKFQNDTRCTKLFLELMQAPYNLTSTLRRMARYGILGRYLPEYNQIIGQMQFDLFHAHTVDAHTLLLMTYLRRLSDKGNEKLYPLVSTVIQNISKPQLLHIAGLYHDIAKGRGGDHSILGALDAEKFCKRHGLNNEDTSLIIWLVKEHLTMSSTAQRLDISDPDILQSFARKVGSITRLNYLYVLTVADINATNPLLWNGWRSSLLQQLYKNTCELFMLGIDNLPSKNDQANSIKQQTLKRLIDTPLSNDDINQLWATMEDDYFIAHGPEELAWQIVAVLGHSNNTPLILIMENYDNLEYGGSKIFIYSQNQPNLFAAMVAALDQLHLIIQDACIFTSRSYFSFDTFTVLERDGSSIGKKTKRINQIKNHLENILTSPGYFSQINKRWTPKRLRHFIRKPEVLISNHIKSRKTELNITATDRPGLLALIGKTFMDLGLEVHRAKIATFGEKVEDHFLITDKNGFPIKEGSHCKTICNQLKQILNPITLKN